MPPQSLTERLQATAGRIHRLLGEAGEMELTPVSTQPGESFALFCVAVGCLVQARRATLAEVGGRLVVRPHPAPRADS